MSLARTAQRVQCTDRARPRSSSCCGSSASSIETVRQVARPVPQGLEARSMTDEFPDLPDERFHRDRREHGGAPEHLDDDRLARLTEEERVEAGLDPFDPDEGPPATDAPVPTGL